MALPCLRKITQKQENLQHLLRALGPALLVRAQQSRGTQLLWGQCGLGQNLQGAPSPSRDCPVAFCKCAWIIHAGIWQSRGKSWLLVPGAVTGKPKGFLAGPEQREEDVFTLSLKGISCQKLQPGAGMLGDGTASVLDS